MVKLAAFWRGGNSLNVCRDGAMIACAANRIGWIGGGGWFRLFPSHAGLIGLPPLPHPPPRLEGREAGGGVVPPGQVWVLSCILRSTSSRLKLAAFWRCGYSLNVCRYCPTKACAGTSR